MRKMLVKGLYIIFFNQKKKNINAVKNVSLNIEKGETVAFIGQNGAGKLTTIKMLTGILYPTSVSIEICGLTPIKNRNQISYKIDTVFGQCSQLLLTLPLTESLDMFGTMYDMSKADIKKRITDSSILADYKALVECMYLTKYNAE